VDQELGDIAEVRTFRLHRASAIRRGNPMILTRTASFPKSWTEAKRRR